MSTLEEFLSEEIKRVKTRAYKIAIDQSKDRNTRRGEIFNMAYKVLSSIMNVNSKETIEALVATCKDIVNAHLS